ncbi:MAG: prepilin-type N-terminal cleavage/methylation domain-containing protein [Verrucomicrobia bacterium]|nr:prepilin-type N-terminal cleavage/methylation domain-containing protein [Verrucomicrobiota bacterium]MCH8525826.1 DUF1559 domain-containing protein [Kiritimatiellia bacterium]
MKTKHTPLLPSRAAFTLIEMLVVIAIIALLVAITIPMVNRGIASAHRSQSMANQRQIGQAFMMYAAENRRTELPPPNEQGVAGHPFGRPWFVAISPYLDGQTGGARDLSSVYRCPVYAREFVRLMPNEPLSSWLQLGYGMNIHTIRLPSGGWPWPDGNAANFRTPLSEVRNPSRTILIADETSWNFNISKERFDHHMTSPNGYWDRTNKDHIRMRGFRHGRGALFLMFDGSVHFLTPQDVQPLLL